VTPDNDVDGAHEAQPGDPDLSTDHGESPVADTEVAERVSPGAEPEPPGRRGPVDTGVTPGMQIAAAWSWRFLVIVGSAAVIGWAMRYLSEVVIPVVVAVLLTALLVPVTNALQRLRLPRGAAAGITVLGLIAVVSGLLTVVGTQISSQFGELSHQVGAGIADLRDLVRINLNITDQQISDYIAKAQHAITSGSGLGARAAEVGTTATHVIAGVFIALFCTFFFLYEGGRIWAWLIRLFPRVARPKADSSGRQAWVSLTAFVRATILVAGVDAIGITIGAAALGLPLVSAIGILVFVGSFVPVVGALVSGSVAVLVALVAKGPLVAVLMLAVVIAVQQLEAHVLQPFLLGRAVSVHPLAVILAIASGVIIAGIVGALVAVPTAAVLNTVVNHLAGNDHQPEPPGRLRNGKHGNNAAKHTT
jgi:predicted PurR-regulated permease PerM